MESEMYLAGRHEVAFEAAGCPRTAAAGTHIAMNGQLMRGTKNHTNDKDANPLTSE